MNIALLATFSQAFWPELVAGLLSGGLILIVGYWRIDKRLQLKERADADREREHEEGRTRTAVLDLILKDLHQNASQANTCLESLPRDELPYPGFEEAGWDLVAQAPAFVTIRPETRDALHHVYNRVRSANNQLELLRDLHNGATSANVHIQVATTMRDDGSFPPAVAEIFDQYETYRDQVRDALIGRVTDLKKYLDVAIDAVKGELEIPMPLNSAQMHYLHETAPERIN